MDIHVHRLEDDNEENRIIPDGGIVRVSVMAMDSIQKQIAGQDQRVLDNIEANQATLKASQRDADRAQGFADHFTAQRQADCSAYGQHCQHISEAWRTA